MRGGVGSIRRGSGSGGESGSGEQAGDGNGEGEGMGVTEGEGTERETTRERWQERGTKGGRSGGCAPRSGGLCVGDAYLRDELLAVIAVKDCEPLAQSRAGQPPDVAADEPRTDGVERAHLEAGAGATHKQSATSNTQKAFSLYPLSQARRCSQRPRPRQLLGLGLNFLVLSQVMQSMSPSGTREERCNGSHVTHWEGSRGAVGRAGAARKDVGWRPACAAQGSQ